jgi:phage terminase large subunit
MSASAGVTVEKPRKLLKIRLNKKCGFLMEMHRFKVLHGGRGGSKSWSVADALLALGAAQKLRILCAREIQDSIKQSVYKLLSDRIAVLGLGNFYKILDTEIRGRNGTEITFTGLGRHTTESIKSFEGIDIVWVEEAQTVAERSWAILIPTIRAKNSEIWVTFNPDMTTDAVWQRFIVNKPTDEPPFDCVVVEINWNDNKHFPEVLNRERLHCKKVAPDDYDNIWEGKCRTSIAGAIYAREMAEMDVGQRIRPLPYDPRHQVHFIWDLGWNDAMTVVMVQKPHPAVLNIINYYEDSFQRYDEVIRDIRALNYNMGWHYLPHDANNSNPQTGTNAYVTIKRLGMRVKPPMQRTDPEARIKAARMMFPRIYIDSSDFSKRRQTGWLGCARLIECLRHYRRAVPSISKANPDPEPAGPKHDQYSHGCDAFGATAEVVDQIADEFNQDLAPTLAPPTIYDTGMGPMG